MDCVNNKLIYLPVHPRISIRPSIKVHSVGWHLRPCCLSVQRYHTWWIKSDFNWKRDHHWNCNACYIRWGGSWKNSSGTLLRTERDGQHNVPVLDSEEDMANSSMLQNKKTETEPKSKLEREIILMISFPSFMNSLPPPKNKQKSVKYKYT